MAVRIQLRGDTAANWSAANPVLAVREMAVETDTGKFKVGDGASAWNSLPYTGSGLPALGTAKQILRVNAAGTGLEYSDPLGSVIAESRADVLAVNTTAETPVVDLALPGGTVAAGDVLRLTAGGSILNNSGASVNYTFRLKIGATTLLTSAATAIAVTGTQRQSRLLIVNVAIETATAQRVSAALLPSGAGTAGAWSGLTTAGAYVGNASSAENTATAKQIQLTVQMGTAHAAAECVFNSATLALTRKR